MRVLSPLLLAVALSSSVCAQTAKVPQFQDYPVYEIYRGMPAFPKIVTPLQRKYRSVITSGVTKGWGVYLEGGGEEHLGPNFAGNMIFIQWGCGVPCIMNAMVDAKTGVIYYPPLPYEGIGARSFDTSFRTIGIMPSVADVEYHLNSRLMVVKASHDRGYDPQSFAYYFLWQDNKWTLLKKVPLPSEETLE